MCQVADGIFTCRAAGLSPWNTLQLFVKRKRNENWLTLFPMNNNGKRANWVLSTSQVFAASIRTIYPVCKCNEYTRNLRILASDFDTFACKIISGTVMPLFRAINLMQIWKCFCCYQINQLKKEGNRINCSTVPSINHSEADPIKIYLTFPLQRQECFFFVLNKTHNTCKPGVHTRIECYACMHEHFDVFWRLKYERSCWKQCNE